MGLLDRIYAGKIIKDFGVIEEKRFGIGNTKTRVLLTKKKGKYLFVLKRSGWAFLSASVSYTEFNMDTASKIKEIILEAEQIVKNQPYDYTD